MLDTRPTVPVPPPPPRLPGVAKLAKLLDDLDMPRAEFARLASQHGTKVDRVTIGQLLDGQPKRVAVVVAIAIRGASRALGREIPIEDWAPVAPAKPRKRAA